MAIDLVGFGDWQGDGYSLLEEGGLQCFDTLADPEFEYDRDELLHVRSAWEFGRSQLSDAQRADLEKVDAYWRANPDAFNEAFAVFHFQKRDDELEGFVEIDGKTAEIPRLHWWWFPQVVSRA